jgi:DNA polymerase-3 subunit delta
LGEDLHGIAAVQAMTRTGTPVAAALRNVRVWGKRQAALERAVRRMKPDELEQHLSSLARLDALSKGIGLGNPWDDLAALALAVANAPVRWLAATR